MWKWVTTNSIESEKIVSIINYLKKIFLLLSLRWWFTIFGLKGPCKNEQYFIFQRVHLLGLFSFNAVLVCWSYLSNANGTISKVGIYFCN